MRSTNLPLFDLFQRQRRYVVPLFQRPYVWSQKGQWEPLWEDVVSRAEVVLERAQSGRQRDRGGNHFLGAIVLNQLKVYGRQVDAVEVIDGQQRLTTLQIMLAAFRDLVKTSDERRLADDLHRLTENDGVRDNEVERFKVWPTNADRQNFEAAMMSGSLAALEEQYPIQRRKYRRKPEPRPRLIEAYIFFASVIRAFCWVPDRTRDSAEGTEAPPEAFSAERAHALYEALRRHLQLVVIELEDEDDPQVIFETLNARGEPLLPSDLIRNFIFQRAVQQEEDTDALYQRWWSEYDERPAEDGGNADQRFWKVEERQGRMRRPRLDLFLYHYVQYQSDHEASIGHLYQAFREWWDLDRNRRAAKELENFRTHSDVFAGFFVPEGDGRQAVFARRLRTLDTSTVYPVLLMLLVGGRDKVAAGELDGILVDLESYLVRRMVCELGTKNYNRFFLAMLERLRSAETISRGLVQEMLLAPEGPAGEWPDDRKFSRAWLERPVYETLKAPRCSMVLGAIDHAMRTRKQESITITGPLTVEHVLPQRWAAPAWPEPVDGEDGTSDDESSVERRNRLLHSFGNLTLLTQELNSSVSNGPYDIKRPEITRQSALRLNTYFQDAPAWSEDQILKRGQALFEYAKQLWPRPAAGGSGT